MTGNENIQVGDRLVCMSNEGLWTIGNERIIHGLTDTSINFSTCQTSWQKRSDVRWGNYHHLPKATDSTEQQPEPPKGLKGDKQSGDQ